MSGAEPQRRAILEAGHAAFAFETGIGVRYVEITTPNAGYCQDEEGLNEWLEHHFAACRGAYILTQMGGMACVCQRSKHSAPSGKRT